MLARAAGRSIPGAGRRCTRRPWSGGSSARSAQRRPRTNCRPSPSGGLRRRCCLRDHAAADVGPLDRLRRGRRRGNASVASQTDPLDAVSSAAACVETGAPRSSLNTWRPVCLIDARESRSAEPHEGSASPNGLWTLAIAAVPTQRPSSCCWTWRPPRRPRSQRGSPIRSCGASSSALTLEFGPACSDTGAGHPCGSGRFL